MRQLGLREPEARPYIQAALLDYIVTSSLAHDRHYDPYSPYYDEGAQAVLAGLTNRYRLVAAFEDRPLVFAHPTIRVYERRGEEV